MASLEFSYPAYMSTAKEQVKYLYQFVDTFRNLCDAHTVDFFTCDHWEKVVPDEWKCQLMAIQDCDNFVYPRNGGDKGTLQDFLYTAKQLRLPVMTGFVSEQKCCELLSFGMNYKKRHEVGRFSSFISNLASTQGFKQVLDIGSGKGYLSEYLVLQHGLTVVGMDSQETNTKGAHKRNRKVYKLWKNVSKSNMQKSDQHCDVVDDVLASGTDTEEFVDFESLFSADEPTVQTEVGNDQIQLQADFLVADRSKVSMCESEVEPKHKEGKVVNKCHNTVRALSQQKTEQQSICSSYCPVTTKVNLASGSTLLQVAEEASDGKFHASDPCCLVGLHTCGDLGSTALRLFCELPTLKAVCVVGCCYHHISEKDEQSVDGATPGFPMSSYLQRCGATLGKTARMLACQSICRFADITSGQALETSFWRAMLEVLLRQKFGGASSQQVVGKLRHSPPDFHSYAKVALQKLGISSLQVSHKEIHCLLEEYEPRKEELQRLLQLRAVLAPCIESLLLLDRLLYLQEQVLVNHAEVVQLFDPEVSPRCFAVCAQK